MERDWRKPYRGLFLYAFMFLGIAFLAASPSEIFEGLKTIVLSSDILITDYLELAGVGPAFANVGLVMVITAILMYANKMPIKSGNIVTIGLMSGFAFFGKNIFNMWFILLGTYLFCALRKEPMSKYLLQSFWASSLGPLISSTFFHQGDISFTSVTVSVVTGLIIGFVTPVLTTYTVRIQHGLNLYNGGFATGLMAMMLTPILKAFGYEFNTVSIWSTQYSRLFTSGLIISRVVILDMGGYVNGPTIGGILTIAGFSVKGKHARNMLPVMFGIILSGLMRGNGAVSTPAAQLALLFGTTLAPVSGTYGPLAGILAGFIHSSVVLYAGAGYSGVNLYNNGFAGGLVAIVMHSVLSEFFKPREYSEPSDSMKPKMDDKPEIDLSDLNLYE